MAIRGVNLSQTLKFVSDMDDEKGTPGETAWYFKKLDGFTGSHLNDNMVGIEQGRKGEQITKLNLGRVSYETVQLTLQEATNFLDPENGMPITITRSEKKILGRTHMAVDEDVMRRIPPELIQEMYQFLQSANAIGASTAKNFAPQS